VDQTWIPTRCLHLRRNVGGFIGHSQGVDKVDKVFMRRSGVGISPDLFFPRTVSGVPPSGANRVLSRGISLFR